MEKNLTNLSDNQLPGNEIKLVFFDIDGTLLGLDGNYSSATAIAIEKIRRLGIKTAIASGRPHFAAQFLVEKLKIEDPGVFCTGAHVYDPAKRETIAASHLDARNIAMVLKKLRESDLYYELYTEHEYFIERNTRPDILQVHSEHMRQKPQEMNFDEVVANNAVIKFIIAVDNQADQQKMHQLEAQFPHLHFAYAGIPAYPDWLFASIIDSVSCKERAFDTLCDAYGVSADQVLSLGDAHSDKVFLQKAGVGIAMGQAKPEIKAAANLVTKPVWEDGVAYALSRIFKLDGVV